MATPYVRSKFDNNREPGKDRHCISFLDEDGNCQHSLTVQSEKNNCDVNQILKKYDKTGLITHVNRSVSSYGDFSEVNEYQDSLNFVIAAREAFDELPADIRKKFNNDPGFFFEFCTNPDNQDEMIELGLAEDTKLPVLGPESPLPEGEPESPNSDSETA